MFLRSLTLSHFRNHNAKHLVFESPTVVIVGPNARGKTSIIEAIALLASGNSFRAETVPEMIQLGQELGRVKGVLEVVEDESGNDESHIDTLEMILTHGLVQGKKTSLRLYSVNDVRKRKKDFTSHFSTVVFRPEDMRLVEGSPGRRRSFIDMPLSMVDPEYARSLSTYDQALIRRNKLLHQIREGEQSASVLTYWNMTLAKHGAYLTNSRANFFDFTRSVEFPVNFHVEYQPSLISLERIAEYQGREIAAGHTLIGPHKDDFSVTLSLIELQQNTSAESQASTSSSTEYLSVATYGSRGQQRLAVLWLKMCEYYFLQQKTAQPPLLLLDDILSELDHESREKVMSLLKFGQSITTTTEPRIVDEVQSRLEQTEVIEL